MSKTATDFNSLANPTVDTERFKIYIDVSATTTPEYELQGRGVTSWTIDQNSDITGTADVLGKVDFERSKPKPQQSVEVALRKNSKFGIMCFNAWFNNDYTGLDNIDILQKFEMIDADTEDSTNCFARLQKECAINITQFMGEAEGKLKFALDIHYSNIVTTGKMPKTDGASITFTADAAG